MTKKLAILLLLITIPAFAEDDYTLRDYCRPHMPKACSHFLDGPPNRDMVRNTVENLGPKCFYEACELSKEFPECEEMIKRFAESNYGLAIVIGIGRVYN